MSMRLFYRGVVIVFASAVFLSLMGQVQVQTQEPSFGTTVDVEFAEKLWSALKEANLVGRKSIRTRPFEGEEPHGKIVTTLEADVVIDGGRGGTAIVKRNYLGDDITVESVATFPRENLDSITVMFQREAGYDPENKNWFWVKYGPGGTVLENQKHTKLAGRVAKGADIGCLACHVGAPGEDFVFLHNSFAEE